MVPSFKVAAPAKNRPGAICRREIRDYCNAIKSIEKAFSIEKNYYKRFAGREERRSSAYFFAFAATGAITHKSSNIRFAAVTEVMPVGS